MKKVEEIGYNAATATDGDIVSFGNDTDSNTAGIQNNYTLEKDYNDVADYNIGDAVSFTLYGSLPDTYADYDHYYYKFIDTLSPGFVTPAVSDITVYVDGTAVTDVQKTAAGITITSAENTGGGTDIGIEIMDAKKLTNDATSIITVKYDAVLDTDAVIGLNGNENTVKLEYANNPNNTGDGTSKPKDDNGSPSNPDDDIDETGETPVDKVIVFTYEQVFNKKDASDGTAITDAKFKFYKTVGGTTTWIKTATTTTDGAYIATEWTATESEALELTTTDGTYKVRGLEDGTYGVKESTLPATYNTPTDDTTDLTIAAVTANGQTWSGTATDALTALTLTAANDDNNAVVVVKGVSGDTSKQDLANGIVEANIMNTKGTQLPATGGIGTTLFILGGGCAAGIGGIYLISKKRTGKEE
jgi:LPXTG-motif cell wall-anchored protein